MSLSDKSGFLSSCELDGDVGVKMSLSDKSGFLSS